jgi:NIPSNAP
VAGRTVLYNVAMILERRQFLGGMSALLAPGAAAEETGRGTRFYVVEQYLLEQGSQPGRIHNFFSNALLPAMERIHKGPKIFLEAVAAPHIPMVTAIFGVESCDQIWSVAKQLFADKDFARAFDAWEAGEPPYISANTSLLEATDYSPEIMAPDKPPAARRIFELRTYHSPTARQRKALDERFSGPEVKIFHRVGIHPVFYTSTVFGANRPNLTYLIPFDSLAAREKAWDAFGADEEWVKVRSESVARGGQINNVTNLSLHRATAYSPVR